jgi:hypothetical protein
LVNNIFDIFKDLENSKLLKLLTQQTACQTGRVPEGNNRQTFEIREGTFKRNCPVENGSGSGFMRQ